MKAINAGELRHRVMLQQRADTLNEFGEPVPAWSPVATLWAKIEPLSGRELLLLKSAGGTETHRITLRYWPGVIADGTQRLAYPPPGQFSSAFSSAFDGGGNGRQRLFTLTSVMDIEERHYLLSVLAVEDLGR